MNPPEPPGADEATRRTAPPRGDARHAGPREPTIPERQPPRGRAGGAHQKGGSKYYPDEPGDFAPPGYDRPDHRDRRDHDPRDYQRRHHDPRGHHPRGHHHDAAGAEQQEGPQFPRKLTVTRVAALRGRYFGRQAVDAFNRAACADGAWESGLTALTYAVMLNYALMASMAVALANTLFFSAATAESKGKVALYLLITIAPFAVIAPVIGPALDRIQRGRRIAMAASCSVQALLCVVMAIHFDDWLLYPAALGVMVMSKSFDVLKAAVAPRVLPSGITLSKTNARLMTFAMAAGGALGAVAAGLSALSGSSGALYFAAVLGVINAVFCMRMPQRVEVTEGEVPASLSLKVGDARTEEVKTERTKQRQPMGRHVVVALWGTGSIRMFTGFMMLFPAFVIKAQQGVTGFQQLALLGLVGAAAGGGSFLGNAIGSRKQFGNQEQMVLGCLAGATVGAVLAAITDSVATAAVAALFGSVASALAKNNLDSVIQDDLPEASRASAFSRSETMLQLAWVFGGAIGVLMPPTFWLGFTVIAVLMVIGLVQTVLTRRGSSLIPGLGGDRPVHPDSSGAPRAPHPPPPPRPGPGDTRIDPHQPTSSAAPRRSPGH